MCWKYLYRTETRIRTGWKFSSHSKLKIRKIFQQSEKNQNPLGTKFAKRKKIRNRSEFCKFCKKNSFSKNHKFTSSEKKFENFHPSLKIFHRIFRSKLFLRSEKKLFSFKFWWSCCRLRHLSTDWKNFFWINFGKKNGILWKPCCSV